MFTAAMFIIGYMESLLPPLFSVPGIKPGFANIPVMIAIYILGWKLAAAMAFTRIILSGLAFTGLFACIYSLSGAVLSILTMVLLKKTKKFSVTAVSMAGGVAHNLGQIIVAWLVLGRAVLYYFPVLVISGLVAGALTGIVTGIILKIKPEKK
jgi:heptaprenyl diphosphate synthase